MKKFMLLHGINHNMFGKRNPEQYVIVTLDEINEKRTEAGPGAGRFRHLLPDQRRGKNGGQDPRGLYRAL